jgi:hypothetical protein
MQVMDTVEIVVKVPKSYLEDAEDFGMLDPATITRVLQAELDERILRFVNEEVKAHRKAKRLNE